MAASKIGLINGHFGFDEIPEIRTNWRPGAELRMVGAAASDLEESLEPMLAHNVYFTLKDRSQAKIDDLVRACDEYLTGHPGTSFYFAGVLEPELARPVNDRAFDVALVIVFESRAAHDVYQIAPRHNEFVAAQKDNWEKVRVFDAIC